MLLPILDKRTRDGAGEVQRPIKTLLLAWRALNEFRMMKVILTELKSTARLERFGIIRTRENMEDTAKGLPDAQEVCHGVARIAFPNLIYQAVSPVAFPCLSIG